MLDSLALTQPTKQYYLTMYVAYASVRKIQCNKFKVHGSWFKVSLLVPYGKLAAYVVTCTIAMYSWTLPNTVSETWINHESLATVYICTAA